MTADEIKAALRGRYAPPAWGFLEEVADATGAAARRRMDGLAMALWPSRGFEIHGFEIKVSRSDWARERASPEKLEGLIEFCDRFFLATPVGLIQPGEVPKGWGLMEVMANGVTRTKVQPVERKPKPVDAYFVAAMVRRACEKVDGMIPRTEVRAEVQAKLAEATEYAVKHVAFDLKELREKVERFAKESGVDIEHTWSLGQVGQAVNILNRGYGDLTDLARTLSALAPSLTEAAEELKKCVTIPATTGGEGE